MSGKFHVLIVGGGIAGPALALFLAKAGLSAAVYEAHGASDGVGGGLGLAPNGMNVIAALGLADRLKARGNPANRMDFRDERGRLLAELSIDQKRYGQSQMSMMRSDVYAVLKEAMQAMGMAVHHGKRLERIEQRSASVIAHFADGTEAEGDLLVGADGIHSRTRSLIMPDAPEPEFVSITGIGGAIALDEIPEFAPGDARRFTFTFGPEGFFGHCGGSAGEAMWWTNLPRSQPYSTEELRSLSADVLRRQLQERFGQYYQPIPALIRRTRDIMALNIFDIQSLPRWHHGRVLLIGDAAHAVSPNAGQGASLALEDAMLLARLLRDCGAGYASAFDRFERDRKPRVERIVAAGRRAASDKTIVSPLRSKIRNLMLGAMFRLIGIPGQDWAFRYRLDWDDAGTTADKAA
jgi:2-polyprenyl-6-methoxyphenol hydroxylase-like FAD-dependent oxidoreductase